MRTQVSWQTKVRFYLSVGLLYAASLVCAGFALMPPNASATPPRQYSINSQALMPAIKPTKLISGEPLRLEIPSRHIDLTIIPGSYNAATDSWTLSGYKAQYDTASKPANNTSGLTFIYGHNNNYVFGALRHAVPATGSAAIINTINGHSLMYKFVKSWSVSPYDTSVLKYQGPPVLLIQTCTGSLNEWRTMYLFSFDKAA